MFIIDYMEFTVSSTSIRNGRSKIMGFQLRQFQEKLLQAIQKGEKVVLVTPTGSGKTFSLLMGRRSVGLYPVIELLEDQYSSLVRTLKSNHFNVQEEGEFHTKFTTPDNQDLVLLKFSATILKGREIPSVKADRIIVFTTPDTFHIYTDMLSQPGKLALSVMRGKGVNLKREDIRKKLKVFIDYLRADMVFVDEFHLYDKYQLRSLISTLKVIRKVHDVDFSIVLSSATPSGESVRKVEQELDIKFNVISEDSSSVSEVGKMEKSIEPSSSDEPERVEERNSYQDSGDAGGDHMSSYGKVTSKLRDTSPPNREVEIPENVTSGIRRSVKNPASSLNVHLDDNVVSSGDQSQSDELVLVRGKTKVRIIEVPVQGRGISKFVNAGSLIPDMIRQGLLDEIRRSLLDRKKRGIIVVDKVGDALDIASAIRERYNERPECKISIKVADCGSDHPFVIGSSAITQGVDYPDVEYGLISRFFAEGVIQAVGRVGRKMELCRVDLVMPQGMRGKIEEILAKNKSRETKEEGSGRPSTTKSTGKGSGESTISPAEFADLIREIYPSLKDLPVDYMDSFRDSLIVSVAQEVYMRLTGHKVEKVNPPPWIYVGDVDSLGSLLMFRFTGPIVTYSLGNEMKRVDMGTLVRNFSFHVERDVFVIDGKGRSTLVASCDQRTLDHLRGRLVSWKFLEMIGCNFHDERGNRVSSKEQVFMVANDRLLAEILPSMGRGIGVEGSGNYVLVFI
jgi:hypothetical protein